MLKRKFEKKTFYRLPTAIAPVNKWILMIKKKYVK